MININVIGKALFFKYYTFFLKKNVLSYEKKLTGFTTMVPHVT